LIDLLYNWLFVPALKVALGIGKFVHPKLKRRALLEAQAAGKGPQRAGPSARYWFHAASMGEFEQLWSVIQVVRLLDPNATITVTLWSPSGYTRATQHPDVDAVYFLPPDGRRTMERFVASLQPHVVIVDRYDLWRNMVRALRQASVPLLLVNATVPSAFRRPWLRSWVVDTYRACTQIFAVTELHASSLRKLVGEKSVPVSALADTRTDRVLQRVENPDAALLALRRPNVVTLVVGSSWPPDEALLPEALPPGLRLVVVPHEPKPPTILRLQQQLSATLLRDAGPSTEGHLVVDTVGQLLGLYAIADAAFVGGGFGVGVHSVTEPAAFGLAIACGPRIERSADAEELLRAGALRVVGNATDFGAWLRELVLNAERRTAAGARAGSVIRDRAGTSAIIAQHAVALASRTRHT
jgi:3-deoxy-D-manno-octulosonic-acid transferase